MIAGELRPSDVISHLLARSPGHAYLDVDPGSILAASVLGWTFQSWTGTVSKKTSNSTSGMHVDQEWEVIDGFSVMA